MRVWCSWAFLNAAGDATRLDWTNRWLATGPRGEARLAAWTEAGHEKKMDNLRRLLTHYLTTGAMLRP